MKTLTEEQIKELQDIARAAREIIDGESNCECGGYDVQDAYENGTTKAAVTIANALADFTSGNGSFKTLQDAFRTL